MSISDRLDEIEQRCADSWSGPWSWELDDEERVTLHAGGSVPFDLIRRDEFRGPSEVAEFIAHARTDLPRLVGALRAVLDLHRLYDECGVGRYRCCEDCEQKWPCATYRAIATALGEA